MIIMAGNKPEALPALVTDIGNVELFFDPMIICRQLLPYSDLPVEEIRERTCRSDTFHDYERGRIDGFDYFNYVHDSVASASNGNFTFPVFQKIWTSMFTENTPVVEMYRGVIDNGHAFIQLSDTNPLHVDYFRKNFPIVRQPAVFSFDVGALKPDAKMYQTVLRKLYQPAENCVFVDDRAENVEGALTAGYGAVFQYSGDNKSLEDFLRKFGFRL